MPISKSRTGTSSCPIYNPMPSIKKCTVPPQTLLSKYVVDGTYTDSYRTEIPGHISLSTYVFAFYTTWLFKVEAFILKYTVKRPSDDAEAQELANGVRTKFAAWDVEGRTENELLMCDLMERTRSWFMVTHENDRTQLYFGSAVVPVKNPKTGKSSLGFLFLILLGFHQVYSYFLLYFASRDIAGNAHV
jgi:hypothetical protein